MLQRRAWLLTAAALLTFALAARPVANIAPVSILIDSPPPRIAIVIDDLAGGKQGTEAMLAINHPMTMAVFPFLPDSKAFARKAKERGFEVILHLPMEAHKAKPHWYPPNSIFTSLSTEEITRIVGEGFDMLPEAVGLNNHMGSRATENLRVVAAVVGVASQRGKFVLDSRTSMKSVMKSIAEETNVPFLQRNLFLDEQANVAHVKGQMRKLAAHAKKNGYAIGIGHVGVTGPVTARTLREIMPELEAEGIQFVHLSALLPKPITAELRLR